MKKILISIVFFVLFTMPVSSKDASVEPNYIYDEILDAKNYEIVDYNYPAGSRELNIFGLPTMHQYNLNAVASPDFEHLVYSEVYFYPDPRVTACALYIIPLPSGLSKREAILSVSTKDKDGMPIIETDYAKLYPFKFDTYTPIDWSKSSNRILFKEKLGQNYDQIYLTKLFVYDLGEEKLYDLNIVRTRIIEYWAKRGVFLEDYKWDIKPLGFLKTNENQVLVNAYGYYQKERKFLGTWTVDVRGKKSYMYLPHESEEFPISSNGQCLRFLPDMGDIFKKQREKDAKTNQIYIEPK